MKGLVFLGLVGATIYGALVLSSDYLLLRDPAENALAGQSLGNPNNRQLRAWGTDLPPWAPPLRRNRRPPSPPLRLHQRPVQPAQRQPPHNPMAQHTSRSNGPRLAKVDGYPSLSSPAVRFYPPGTTLQVLNRQNGWAQITDPTSGDRGWVYEQYLSPADGPTATQTAMADTASRVAAEPVGANRPTAKKRVRASRPAARMSGEYAFARFDRRWERRADRRGGIGLFFFGRFARAE